MVFCLRIPRSGGIERDIYELQWNARHSQCKNSSSMCRYVGRPLAPPHARARTPVSELTTTQDAQNVVCLEHINLNVPSADAQDFYCEVLGLTRDPYVRAVASE